MDSLINATNNNLVQSSSSLPLINNLNFHDQNSSNNINSSNNNNNNNNNNNWLLNNDILNTNNNNSCQDDNNMVVSSDNNIIIHGSDLNVSIKNSDEYIINNNNNNDHNLLSLSQIEQSNNTNNTNRINQIIINEYGNTIQQLNSNKRAITASHNFPLRKTNSNHNSCQTKNNNNFVEYHLNNCISNVTQTQQLIQNTANLYNNQQNNSQKSYQLESYNNYNSFLFNNTRPYIPQLNKCFNNMNMLYSKTITSNNNNKNNNNSNNNRKFQYSDGVFSSNTNKNSNNMYSLAQFQNNNCNGNVPCNRYKILQNSKTTTNSGLNNQKHFKSQTNQTDLQFNNNSNNKNKNSDELISNSINSYSISSRMSSEISNAVTQDNVQIEESKYMNNNNNKEQSSIWNEFNNYNDVLDFNKVNKTKHIEKVPHNLMINDMKEEMYSRKVFVGGLPPDIDEDAIVSHFARFGSLIVDWPHKSESKSSKSCFPPKGYAFLIFQIEKSVQNLMNTCSLDDDKYYIYVSSPSIKNKPVQIRPWNLSDADCIMDATQPLDPRKTIFVGGVPRPLKSLELAMIMNRLYGGVCYAGIDTDQDLKYPKGAGRVAFSNQQSYITAISARFVQLQHGEIDKRVEVKPYVLDDQICDECHGNRCGNKHAPFFCANVTCLQYYCEYCWSIIHSKPEREFHKPLVKEGADRPRAIPFRWC